MVLDEEKGLEDLEKCQQKAQESLARTSLADDTLMDAHLEILQSLMNDLGYSDEQFWELMEIF